MRVRLKGINSITKTLADGSRRTYYYAWKGGPPLRGEPGTPEFMATATTRRSQRKVDRPQGTMLQRCKAYQQAPNSPGSPSGRARLHRQDQVDRREFGDFPLAALTDRRTRGILMEWRDQVATSHAGRPTMRGWCSPAFSRGHWTAADRSNPRARGGRLYHGTRVDKIWTHDDEAAFLKSAPAHLHLPLLLALWTGQRQGDLLRLPWSAYDGTHIRLRQSKTGASRVVNPGGRTAQGRARCSDEDRDRSS